MLHHLRQEYNKDVLREDSLDKNPLKQFDIWFKEAIENKILEPNAMVLSTGNSQGHISSRTVLLKEKNNDGFVFYTNYQSAKGKHIKENNNVSLLFLWLEMQRQIIVKGKAFEVESKTSDEYFNIRPFESQIGAIISNQSNTIMPGEIEKKYINALEYYKTHKISRPPHWGGYLVKPIEIEFWQGRPSRLHDRILYTLNYNEWNFQRLQP